VESESEGARWCGAMGRNGAQAKAKARSLHSQFRQTFLYHCWFLGLLGAKKSIIA
jgi:hypothetical protein